MEEVYETLAPTERDFFNSLDFELAKVDQFFIARERDALIKVSALRGQMQELKQHHKLFHVSTFISI
jgi:SPX domain